MLLSRRQFIEGFHFHLPRDCVIDLKARKPTLFCLNRNSCNFGGNAHLVEVTKTLCNAATKSMKGGTFTCKTLIDMKRIQKHEIALILIAQK